MLTSGSAYVIAWAVYIVCFFIALFAFSRLIKRLRPTLLRRILQGSLVVLFLTPVSVEENDNWYAPAWLEGGYETILGDVSAASGAIFNLSVAAAGMTLLIALDSLWRRRRS